MLISLSLSGFELQKNERGGSATQLELRGWGGGGHNGMNRGTGGLIPPVNSNPDICWMDDWQVPV